MARLGTAPKVLLLAMVFGWVVMSQLLYDATKPQTDAVLPSALTPGTIRMIDFGFHSTIASFLWVGTMPEIVDLFRSRREYLTDLQFVNDVDPKLSYPYAFSVLTMPGIPKSKFPDSVERATEIGLRGIANADPDWRIPYYMAINYYLDLRDLKEASWYFNLAANTPGVPDYAKRFSLNFGINQKERDRVRNLWATVYASTNDPDTKARAAAYVERLNMLDYLEANAKTYKDRFGAYPATPQDLVTKGLITEVPQDPFGFTFTISKDGIAGIDTNKLPPGFTQ